MNTLIRFDNSYEQLPEIFYTKIPLSRSIATDPELLYFNEELGKELGLDVFELEKNGLGIFSGTSYPSGASSIAQAYMGHQFGHLAMLGDGRANLVGEVISPKGKRYDIQLKGSGPTPFSRGGDGKAALGPMLKEYLFSEGLYQLGIPSSRSLALVKTGDKVYRQRVEEGAILTRVMESHLRVGTFTYAATIGDKGDLKTLADYGIDRHYPELKEADNPYRSFYHAVIKAQAETVAKWMVYGFVHGVMNTDNMAISGETFDYGPCAMLDEFNIDAVFSSIDQQGRYAYGNQSAIAVWNLHRLGEALMPLLIGEKEGAQGVLEEATEIYRKDFMDAYYELMGRRLGFKKVTQENNQVVAGFTAMMAKSTFDFHQTFKDLTTGNLEGEGYQQDFFQAWLTRWMEQVTKEGSLEEARIEMKTVNPSVVLRNYWVKKAIEEGEKGDLSLYEAFYEALKNPFSYDESHKAFGPMKSEQPYVTFCGT